MHIRAMNHNRPLPLRRAGLPVFLLLFALAGCSAPAAPLPTQLVEQIAAPSPGAPYPPPMSAPSSKPYPPPLAAPSSKPYPAPYLTPTETQPLIEEATVPPEAAPTQVALPRVEGEIVLTLAPGSALVAFRIGGDGTIRLLDNSNRHILFFDEQGQLLRSVSIAEATNPVDFIVDPQGAIFVFDRGDGLTTQVLRYAPNGKLVERLPLDANVGGADGIMLTADQDLLIVSSNQMYWSLIHKGVVVAPELQPLTIREGMATPRSPLIFRTTGDANGTHTLVLESITSPGTIANVALDLPQQVGRFFNIDRAMNLYFIDDWGNSEMTVARVAPDGVVAGGAHIHEAGCQFSWRRVYIDQSGAAWSLCANDQGTTVRRYTLLSPTGQPLPELSKEPADVIWRPGAQIDLSSA